MKKWTENKAVSQLISSGVEIREKVIIAKGGFKGLSCCSALDFLCNHCGYKSNL
jgi:hypothetical protein